MANIVQSPAVETRPAVDLESTQELASQIPESVAREAVSSSAEVNDQEAIKVLHGCGLRVTQFRASALASSMAQSMN